MREVCVDRLLLLFMLPPVFRGGIALVVSGACFPLCGVMVLRLQLVPLRYMLMHGVILGGALALAFSLPLVPVILAVNIVLIFAMTAFTKNENFGFGGASAAAMVFSMALASLVVRIGGVPAKDTLSLLWGSPFALGVSDLTFLAGLAIFLASYVLINFRNIAALFYSREIAYSLGIHVRVHYTFMVAIIAFTVAIAMKLLGAFLIDALLVLPVLSSAAFLRRKKGQGIGSLFLLSSVSGCIFAAGGYVLAVVFDLPPGAVIAIIAGIAYAVFSVI